MWCEKKAPQISQRPLEIVQRFGSLIFLDTRNDLSNQCRRFNKQQDNQFNKEQNLLFCDVVSKNFVVRKSITVKPVTL